MILVRCVRTFRKPTVVHCDFCLFVDRRHGYSRLMFKFDDFLSTNRDIGSVSVSRGIAGGIHIRFTILRALKCGRDVDECKSCRQRQQGHTYMSLDPCSLVPVANLLYFGIASRAVTLRLNVLPSQYLLYVKALNVRLQYINLLFSS